jgi:menaquinone-dependent protoporphyrinogen oxidase
MSKVLVVYGTKTGCTEGIAEQIGTTLSEIGAHVDVLAASDKPDPAGYDAVVVGSGVRVGNWHSAVSKWVDDNAEALRGVPVAFFTGCLTMAIGPEKSDEVRAYTDGLLASTGLNPVGYGLFAGMNEPKKFSVAERLVMKVMKAPQGDFRDFDAIADWTRATAPKLGVV